MSALSTRGLGVTYADGTVALRPLDLDLPAGQRVAVVGASGSGKTTLARALFALAPSEGSLSLLGTDPRRARHGHLARRAQLLFQRPAAMLHPAMRLDALLRESARVHDQSDITAALERVGLGHRATAYPHELSGGEKRRAGIARVLLARPEFLVADEPTTGLDANLRPLISELLFAPGRTTVLITHDIGLAARCCERLLVFDRGTLVDDAPSLTALQHPAALALADAAGVSA